MARTSEPVQIASAGFKRDPHPFYDRLRAESPVHAVVLPDGSRAFLLTRYEDVAALLKDDRYAKDRANAMTPAQLKKARWMPPIFRPLLRNMLDRDDPDHARLRRLVQKAFTQGRVEALRARTEQRCAELIDALERKREFDLIADFALPLPVAVISDLLGVPLADRGKFARWSKTLISNTMTPLSVLRSLPHMIAFVRYLRWLIGEKRARPMDDLVSALARQDTSDQQLSDDELVGMIAILLTAGHETTTNLIGNGMLALIENPEQRERLRREPALLEPAVEELLRFAGPVATSTHRYARQDIELHGTRIPRGEVVLGVIASANRDERQFARGDTLDLARDPNRHLTFGQGGHYCVGAPLARMEGKIAFEALLRRLPTASLAASAGPLKWRPGLVLHGLDSLWLTRSG